jgi:hypothetical protein
MRGATGLQLSKLGEFNGQNKIQLSKNEGDEPTVNTKANFCCSCDDNILTTEFKRKEEEKKRSVQRDYQADPFAISEEESEEDEDIETRKKEQLEKAETVGALQEDEEVEEQAEHPQEKEEEKNEEVEMDAPHPKKQSKWMKIRMWSFLFLLSSLLILGGIVAVDIYLYSTAESTFTTKSIDFYVEGDNSADAKCVVRGEYPTHSAFSSYNVVHPKCVIGYSNDGKSRSNLNILTTAHISVERLRSSPADLSGIGPADSDPIKINIDLKNTEYGNFAGFLLEVLDHSSKNTYGHLDCRTDLEIQLLNFIPVTARNIRVSRWFPLQVNHRQNTQEMDIVITNETDTSDPDANDPYANETETNDASTNEPGTGGQGWISEPDLESIFGWRIPKALARQEFPKFSLTSSSASKLEVGADWAIKNPIHFAKFIPSVILHVPEISYSMSVLGDDHIRWNSASTPLEFDLTHSHFHLETNFTLETRDRSFSDSKLPLASAADVSKFFDRLAVGEIDIVWDAETDNFLTRLLGINHHIGMSVNASIDSAGGCYELSTQYNGNTAFGILGCSAHDEDNLWRIMMAGGEIDSAEIIALNTSSFMNQKSLVSGELKFSSETSGGMNETAVSLNFRMMSSVDGSFEAGWSSASLNSSANEVDMNLNVSLMFGTVDDRIFDFTSQTMGSLDDDELLLNSETSWCLKNVSDAFRLNTEISLLNNAFLEGNLLFEVELESLGSVNVVADYDLQDPHDW